MTTFSASVQPAPSPAGIVTAGDIKMYYGIHGQGEPLLLIMGFGGSVLDWGWVLPPRLAERYRIIMFDNRGAGRSDQPLGPYSIKQMADDAANLMDALGLERASVFGASMGGMIAQELALNYPGKVKLLILGCTTAGGSGRVMAPPEIQAYLEPRTDMTLYQMLWWSAPGGFPQEFIDAHRDIVERKIQSDLIYPSQLPAYKAQLAAFKAHDAYSRLPSLRVPSLILVGDRDILIPPENSRILSRIIPGARLQIIEGAGHIFWISHPEETFFKLADFLDKDV
ncbi:MAG TPA: alpha/beta hydrolase [Methanotrichaceae archaeon]|nr:alpha/beta hydrolase [Methanotrichaceae archaeon]